MNYQFQLQIIKQQLGNIDTQFTQLMSQMQYMTAFNVYNMAVQIFNIGKYMLNIRNKCQIWEIILLTLHYKLKIQECKYKLFEVKLKI